jgi:hypothetical protein
MNILDTDIPLPNTFTSAISSLPAGSTVNPTTYVSEPLIESGNQQSAVTIPLESFGDFLEGFEFDADGIKSYLFVSGSPIVQALGIELDFGSSGKVDIEGFTTPRKPDEAPSVFDPDSDVYTGTTPPTSDEPATTIMNFLLNNQTNQEINFKVSFRSGSYPISIFSGDLEIVIEMIVWIPLVIEPTSDPTGLVALPTDPSTKGAELTIPELKAIGEFISQLPDMIKTLNLEVGLNNNTFGNGYLVIRDPAVGFSSVNQLKPSMLNISFTDQEMEIINNAEEFAPTFSIFIPQGGSITIPREFKIVNFSVEAHLEYRMDLLGSSGEEF